MTERRNVLQALAERLQRRLVVGANGCIEWTGARTASGYGRIGRGRRGEGWTHAHRAAWEVAHGPIPEGLCVLHRCDNPPCCNPEHLFLGSLEDNSRDMVTKGRGRKQIPAGEAHPDARLTDADVAELRGLAPSVGNYAELGRRFGISKQHARALVLRAKRA